MTTHNLFVKNIACTGSMANLKNSMLGIKGIASIDFDIEENKICIKGVGVEREELIAKLVSLGYQDKDNDGFFSKNNSFEYWYCYLCASCDS